MTPLREWLKPPRTLLLILFLLTLVSVSALGWFGWKVLDQEHIVAAQRVQERLEQSADRIAATLRSTLAEEGERLGASIATPPEGGLLLRVGEKGLTAQPAGGLLYYPYPSAEPEARPAIFAEPEALEFLQGQPDQALASYRRLTNAPDAAVRAGAWLRAGRVLRRMGRVVESLAAYRQLAATSGVRVADAPAELVGRHAISELAKNPSDADGLRNDLARGRWHLTRGQFEFYWSEAARLTGRAEPPERDPVALAEAADLVWRESRQDRDARRAETVWLRGEPLFLLWRGASVLVTKPEFWLKPVFAGEEVFCAAVDSEGHLLAGRKTGGHAAVRTAAESQIPWTIYVTGTPALAHAGFLTQQRFLLLGIAVMVVFLILGTYFIARAIRREMEVARMQSDFVAAVSHEFRSPLTSMRQLSEILALGRAPSEERRQVYYETLVRESSRLQRLVEALLNFGKMEAGARLYKFEEMDAGALVDRVVAEFAPQVAGQGCHIETAGPESRCLIEADPEAISVALRNLVDNAIKYSPNQPTVWVEWGKEDTYVAIRVRDQGPGIAETERKAIFRKFVRGSAAVAANVKGSGVGLAMVRHIVAAHGGEITVASELGKGSTFTMLLPGVGRA
jgi:signal transduction histidine kinase